VLSATHAEDLKSSTVLRDVIGELAPFVDLICSEPVRQRATIAATSSTPLPSAT